MTGRKGLTRRDFDEVMRRAAELATEEGDTRADEEFSDEEVVRIGREVGLADRHVRSALAEHRSGAVRRSVGAGEALRALMSPGRIRSSRTIARNRSRIRSELDEFMVGGQLLQRVRTQPGLLQYRPAVDWASRVARAASSSSREHYVSAARSVEVRMDPEDGSSTRVEIVVDPGVVGNYRTLAVAGGGLAAVGGAVGVGALLALWAPVIAVVAVGGALAGALAGAGATLGAARRYQHRLAEVQMEVESVLDGLETPGGLEPPPPAWRRWVRRHFHGVAREITGRRD